MRNSSIPTFPPSGRDFAKELADSAKRAELIAKWTHHAWSLQERFQASIARTSWYKIPDIQEIATSWK